jgi:hypothetical protein
MFCSQCNSELRRSHRRGMMERLAAAAGLYPYRCPHCKLRCLRLKSAFSATKRTRRTAVEREIRSTRAHSRKKRTRREFLLYGTGILFFLGFLYFLTRERPNHGDAD